MADIYSPLFRKEGVAHEIQKLAAVIPRSSESNSTPTSAVSSPIQQESSTRVTRSQKNRHTSIQSTSEDSKGRSKRDKLEISKEGKETKESKESSSGRRKRASPDGSPASKKEKEARRKSSGIFNALRIPGIGSLGRATTSSNSASPTTAPSTPPPVGGLVGQLSTFFWYCMYNNLVTVSQASNSPSSSSRVRNSEMSSSTKDKLRNWIKKEAAAMLKTYFADCGTNGALIDSLSWIAQQLRAAEQDVGTTPLSELHDILRNDSVSAFEMMYSGVIPALQMYLVSEELIPSREERLKRFASVFMHLTEENLRPTGSDDCFNSFESLIAKVLASVAQLEQFPVKVCFQHVSKIYFSRSTIWVV